MIVEMGPQTPWDCAERGCGKAQPQHVRKRRRDGRIRTHPCVLTCCDWSSEDTVALRCGLKPGRSQSVPDHAESGSSQRYLPALDATAAAPALVTWFGSMLRSRYEAFEPSSSCVALREKPLAMASRFDRPAGRQSRQSANRSLVFIILFLSLGHWSGETFTPVSARYGAVKALG